MISPECESYVRTLLASGEFSQRVIAKRAGVARGTVDAIASGRRAGRAARYAVRTADGRLAWQPEDPERVDRCATCGHRVLMPCLACFVRSIRCVFGGKR